MNRRVQRLLIACVAVVVIVGGVLLFTHRARPTAAPDATSAAPAVPLARAVFGPYTTQIRAQGRVGAPSGSEAKLAFANAGIVAQIDAHVGQTVVAGQRLAALDTSGLALDRAQAKIDVGSATASYGGGSVAARALASTQARLVAANDRLTALERGTGSAQSDRQAALAAVRQSENKLSNDQRALDRETTLFNGGVAARKDVDAARQQLVFDQADSDANRAKAASAGSNIGSAITQARADTAQAQSDVRAAQAQGGVSSAQAAAARTRYAAAQRNFDLATLRAPSDGVVMAILKHAGEAVDPTQPAIVIGPPSSSAITLTVGGDAARDVRTGDGVSIRIASQGRTGTGRVRSVVPSVDPTTQTSTIVVAGVPAGAIPGDAVEATIDIGVRRGIVIPTSAIVEDPQTGKSIVFVRERQKDGTEKFVSREIRIATGDEERSLVASGLRGGERVASQGAFDLLAPGGGG